MTVVEKKSEIICWAVSIALKMSCDNSSFYGSQSYLGQPLRRAMKDGWLSDHYNCLRFAREFAYWARQNGVTTTRCHCKCCALLLSVLEANKALVARSRVNPDEVVVEE